MTLADATPALAAPQAPPAPSLADAAIDRIRAFNRYYTRRLDILAEHYLDSPFTLVEARLVWEIADRRAATAADLARDLGLDPGQASRILKRFEARGLIHRTPAPDDGRRSEIRLTEAGLAAFAAMDAEQRAKVGRDVAALDGEAVGRLTAAMADVRRLGDSDRATLPLIVRPHRAGDVSWVCHRQVAFYAEVYGFRGDFETLVMDVGADFLRTFDPRRDASFLAEVDGRVVGSIFVTRAPDPSLAKLRLLWVESEMRGRGLGGRLIGEAVRFARDAGYARMTLWTHDVLDDARRLYARAGFRLVGGERNAAFGPEIVSEHWDLDL
ncbi:MarR family transcriptional regulator [Siculibacillus lacustris]|uniref:MarR family transcriptional regulator n=1 Tax=Siculibacillus lacustris TaxID=1549641 RepID=A0A4Q9VFZ0_9HYPH|nr:bifunctional helix-turn-helix transcriptional regulator/GNAT family N-acetyltransferase [Siculibacillus lacustris]TBW33700.1 MarR family transcriptional regulator [Siculibacillus lacustris]